MFPDRTTLAIIKLCALGVLLIAGYLWAHGRGADSRDAEVYKIRAEHAKVLRDLAERTADVARKVREREAQYNTDSATAADQYDKEMTDALSKRDAVIAGLRADNLRLRPWWGGQAVSCPGDAATPAAASRDAEGAERRASDAGNLVRISAESDAWVSWLQRELVATREVCSNG